MNLIPSNNDNPPDHVSDCFNGLSTWLVVYSFYYICDYLYLICYKEGIRFNNDSGILFPLNCDQKLANIFCQLHKISKNYSYNDELYEIIKDIYDVSCSYAIYKQKVGYFTLDADDQKWILIRQLCSILLKKAY